MLNAVFHRADSALRYSILSSIQLRHTVILLYALIGERTTPIGAALIFFHHTLKSRRCMRNPRTIRDIEIETVQMRFIWKKYRVSSTSCSVIYTHAPVPRMFSIRMGRNGLIHFMGLMQEMNSPSDPVNTSMTVSNPSRYLRATLRIDH